MKTIDRIIDHTIGKEGGYVNHPADRGGPTIWGVTERVARANGYNGRMQDMPRSVAVAIYRAEYAIKPGFMKVAEIFPDVGAELFDTGVNMGPSRPAKWLQEWLNALNNGGKHFADVVADGKIGPATLSALRALKATRGAEGGARLLKGLNASQGAEYLRIAQRNPSQEAFLYGWLDRL